MALKPIRKTKSKDRHRQKRNRLIRKLDKLCPEYIKLRDMRQCQRCGSFPTPHGCHWAHIQSRTAYHIRWKPYNSLVLCYGCHQYLDSHPNEMMEWYAAKFPERSTQLEHAIRKWHEEGGRQMRIEQLGDDVQELERLIELL